MRIAATSHNFRTVTGHVGKKRRFLIFAGDCIPPREVDPAHMAEHQHVHTD